MIFVAACAFGLGVLVGVILAADYLEKECGCDCNKD